MQTLYGVQELADRWGLNAQSVRKMEQEGKLHRVPGVPGVKYPVAEVFQLESAGLDAQALSVFERKRLTEEIRELKAENENLRQRLLQAQNVLMGV